MNYSTSGFWEKMCHRRGVAKRDQDGEEEAHSGISHGPLRQGPVGVKYIPSGWPTPSHSEVYEIIGYTMRAVLTQWPVLTQNSAVRTCP